MEDIKKIKGQLGEEYFKHLKDALDDKIDETNIDTFKDMKKILNKIFGEDNNQIVKPSLDNLHPDEWLMPFVRKGDASNFNVWKKLMQPWIEKNSNYEIIIRFPEFEITNSKGGKHTIKDLYVKFEAKSSGTLTGTMEGIRSTLSMSEAQSNYLHSHLRLMNVEMMHWEGFCLGSGEIQQPLAVLRTAYSDVNFTILCLHLQNYVIWESLEGNPYAHMANIVNRGRSAIDSTLGISVENGVTECVMRKIKEKLTVDKLMNMLTFNVSPRGVQIECGPSFEVWIADIIRSVDPKDMYRGLNNHDMLLVLKDSAGNYFRSGPERKIEDGKVLFTFKEKEIRLKIIKDEKEVENIKYPHPSITRQICTKLSRSITKCAFDYKEISA